MNICTLYTLHTSHICIYRATFLGEKEPLISFYLVILYCYCIVTCIVIVL